MTAPGAFDDGLLPVYKPVGVTSHDVVAMVRRRLRVKAGHAGTLDPMAQGVLLVFLGEALKLLHLLPPAALDKTYLARITLGSRTDTDDAAGAVIERSPIPADLSDCEVARVLGGFVGERLQVPPAYSALKVQGERAHVLAREGREVVLEPRSVTIGSAVLLRTWLGPERNELLIRVSCSRGTYLRALARDLARELGTSGHLSYLLRERVGGWRLHDTVPLAWLPGRSSSGGAPGGPEESRARSRCAARLAPLERILPFPVVAIGESGRRAVARGGRLALADLRDDARANPGPVDAPVQVVAADGRLLAVYRWRQSGVSSADGSQGWSLIPCRVLQTALTDGRSG